MLLSGQPTQLVLPFASSGSKNTIPVASQIGVTPGAASYTDGFPPLTRLAVSAGGVPPYGLDFNGILNSLSATDRWACAGAGYTWSSAFASNSNIGGYPAGARIVRSDGRGYWLNITDNNTVDPESGSAVAAGWVPDYTNGLASVTMTNANVTLSPSQYGFPIIVVIGALTANVNLIFPAIFGSWTVVNSTTGAFTITCKTASGSGIALVGGRNIFCDGTNIRPVNVGFQTLATITTSGNFTVPANIFLLDVELWGGGGGGGNGAAGGSAGGGGAGGYTRGTLQVTPGQVIVATIGSGGAGTGAGNSTTFSTLSATGGAQGTSGAGGAGGAAGGGTGGAGSVLNYTSANGGSGWATFVLGGKGGDAAGGGGCGGVGIAGGGVVGTAPGGGGGGGSSSTGLGAAGANGQINIRY